MWKISAVIWVLDNREYMPEIVLGRKIEDPAKEETMTQYLETVEVPDLERAVAAGHELLDKHVRETGEFGLEIYLTPPQLPHADQERLGIKDYKLAPEAGKRARAIGIRGRDLEARLASIVRHAAPFEHRTANLRFRGIIFTWRAT